MLQKSSKIDPYRVYKRNYAASKDKKEKWKVRRQALVKKQHVFQHLEGVKYKSQTVYEIGDQGKNWGKVEEKVMEIQEKRENTGIYILHQFT